MYMCMCMVIGSCPYLQRTCEMVRNLTSKQTGVSSGNEYGRQLTKHMISEIREWGMPGTEDRASKKKKEVGGRKHEGEQP